MRDQTLALLLTIAPICAFAFAGLFLETLRLVRLNRRMNNERR